MTCLRTPLAAPRSTPLLQTLPPNLSAPLLLEIGRLLGPSAASEAAGDAEYASWMPDPGAIEVASWAAGLRMHAWGFAA